MARGLLPGAIALSGKFMPAVRKVAGQTLASAKQFLAEAPEQQQQGGGAGRHSGGGGGGAARHARAGSGDGLRARRREVELSDAAGRQGGGDAGTSRFGTEAAAGYQGGRKDD